MNRRDAIKSAAAGFAAASAAAQSGASSSSTEAAQPDNPGARSYLILSCEGGGIRGVISARIIQELNRVHPFLDKVDLFAGTSTGGIIALALASGIPIDEVVELYAERGKEIFGAAKQELPAEELGGPFKRRYEAIKMALGAFAGALDFTAFDLFNAEYASDSLSGLLSGKLEDKTFRDLSDMKKSALVTSFRLSRRPAEVDQESKPTGVSRWDDSTGWEAKVFHNLPFARTIDPTLEDGPTPDIRLVDAALASSAAPLYFPPHMIPGVGFFVDGGLFANNPSAVAYAVASRSLSVIEPQRIGHIRILSIGTGEALNAVDVTEDAYQSPRRYGMVNWLRPRLPRTRKSTPAYPLIAAMFHATGDAQDYVCRQILGASKYRRVQPIIPDAPLLDATGEEALKRLKQATDDLFASPAWENSVRWLRDATG